MSSFTEKLSCSKHVIEHAETNLEPFLAGCSSCVNHVKVYFIDKNSSVVAVVLTIFLNI